MDHQLSGRTVPLQEKSVADCLLMNKAESAF